MNYYILFGYTVHVWVLLCISGYFYSYVFTLFMNHESLWRFKPSVQFFSINSDLTLMCHISTCLQSIQLPLVSTSIYLNSTLFTTKGFQQLNIFLTITSFGSQQMQAKDYISNPVDRPISSSLSDLDRNSVPFPPHSPPWSSFVMQWNNLHKPG